MIIHVPANVPAPTTFVTTAVVGRSSGKYGTKTLIKTPTITGGQGSLIGFHATLHRTWTYKGKRRSLLYASCPSGSLFAHGEFDFANGTMISGDVRMAAAPSRERVTLRKWRWPFHSRALPHSPRPRCLYRANVDQVFDDGADRHLVTGRDPSLDQSFTH
ncbi:MAG TPA: hypothetical protein VF770_05580 [Solirubrobacterales bacterium]